MKKRILSMLLAVVMLLGMFPGVASAADSVEEALGEVDIYNGGQKLSYLSINGRVRELIYTYYNYVDRNGNTKEIPAYCVNPNTKGVPQTVPEGESIKYLAEEIGTDPKVMGIIANGYPHRGLGELKLENKYQAYYATKMALWCYLLSHWDINNLKVNPDLTGVELERANKMLAAAKDIYRRGTAWSTVLSPNVTVEPDQEVAYPATVNGQEYLQQIFTVTSDTWVCDYTINVAFTDPSAVPAGTKIVDMNNREIDVITTEATGQGYSGQFKVLYPAGSVEGQSGSVQLSFRTNVYKYAIYYAVCAETDKYGNLQNYMVDTDPTTPLALTAYSNYTDTPEEIPTETSLKIIKYEEGTTIPLRGALFEVVDPEGASVGTFTTNSKGQIVIPLTLAGNYTVYEREAPNGYLLSEEPAQNVKVEYGRQATVTFENAPYGNLLVRKFSDSGMQLPGAAVRIEHIESGAVYTGETNYAGVAVFNEIEPGAYRITEIAAPAGYIMSDEVYNTTVLSGDTVEVSIVNEEKPGLRIIKYDSKTHEAMPNISFEVFRDTQSLGIFKTDEFGEILLTDLDPGTYLVKEVATDSSHIINSNPQQIELEGSDGILELFFFNDQKPGIHLVKLDSTSLEPLPNARFRIELVGGTFSKEYVTDENGEVDISDLEPGAYRVTELEAPDGYLIDDAQRVIQINGNENAQFVFTNTRKPSITVVKYDPVADKYLPGAIFRVAKIEDGSHYLDRVTETNGSFTITDLEPGVYSVQEQAAPSGYVLNSHEYHVELFPGQNSQVVVVNEAKPDLRIIKTDADTGKPVSGVTFTIRYADGSTITTEATDENGEVFLEDMEPGAYEVWEQSVPENYILDTEHQHITLEPNRIGTVQFQNHQRPTLVINKVDLNGKALTGAIFELKTKAGVKIGDFPVDANGKVTISNVHLTEGYYIITETQAPAGYILDSTPHEVYLRPGKTTEISIENEEKPDLLIQKIDSVVGDGIKGAKFEILVAKDKSTDGAYERLDNSFYFTDANGQIKIDDLDTGWYKIVEVEPASGYMLKEPSEQTVYVDNDKSVTVVFENIPKSALVISKVDADTGIGLPGAWFRVRYLGGTSGSGGTIIGEYQTSSNGNIILTGMDAGTFIVEEISAPDGYVIDTASQTAYISGNEQDVVTLTFTNSAKGGLLIKKVDSVTGKPLSDVQFFVTDSDGSVIGSANGYFTTDINGSILISDITPGITLVVKETRTRSGYVLDDTPQSIKIQSNAIMTLEFRNQPKGGLIVVKKDAVTGETLSGVQFKITTASGELVANNEGMTSSNGLYTTDENGQIVLSNVMPDTYVVTETQALDGYILNSTPQTVVVNAGDTQTLTFTNQPYGGLLIKKMDSVTKEPLADVVFKVTTSDGSVVGSGNGLFRTDENGFISIPGLEPDSYIVTEVQAKKGYLLDDVPRTIEIRDEKTHTLEFFNQPLGSLVIHKLDSVTKKPLEGVQFKITYADGKVVDAAGGQLSSNGLYWTDENGQITISGITGTVVVTEVETVPGYTIHEESRSQTVVVNTNDTQSLYFYNAPIGGVEIIKVNEANTSERIPNTTFEIRKVDDELVDTVTTDKNGRVFCSLEDGAYYAVEIEAAEGFKLDDTPVYFEVENGQTVQLRVTNQAYSGILIHKTDANTGEGIYGVSFLLYDSGKNPIGEYVSDDRGYVYIEDIPSGRYYLRELEPAEGYIADTQLKSIYVTAGTTTEVEWENTAITGQIQITKTSADYNSVNGWPAGTPIPNTVFEVYHARTGKLMDTIQTNKNGVATTKPLPLGRYKLVESRAADFYGLDKTPIEVEIEHAGQIVKTAMTNKSLYTNVSIKKTGYTEVMPGQSIRYDFSEIANNSTTVLTSFYWRDTLPTNAVRLDKIVTGTYNVQGNYKIVYRTNLTGDSYRTLADNLNTMKNYVLDASPAALGLASNEYVTEFMVTFGVVPANFRQVESPKVYCNVVSWLTGGTQFVNQADVGGVYNGQWIMAATRWVTRVYKPSTTTLPRTGY